MSAGSGFRALPASLDPRLSSVSVDHGRVTLGSPTSPPLASSSKARMALENLRNSLVPVSEAACSLPSYSTGRESRSMSRVDLQLEIEALEIGRLSREVMQLKDQVAAAEQEITEQKFIIAEKDMQNSVLLDKVDSLTTLMHEVKHDTYDVEKNNRELNTQNKELIEANGLVSSELMQLTDEANCAEARHVAQMRELQAANEELRCLKQHEVKLLQTELIKYEHTNKDLMTRTLEVDDLARSNTVLTMLLQEAVEEADRQSLCSYEAASWSALLDAFFNSVLLRERTHSYTCATTTQLLGIISLERYNTTRVLNGYFLKLLLNVQNRQARATHVREKSHLQESSHWNSVIGELQGDVSRANDVAAISESAASHAQQELHQTLTKLSIAEQQCRELEVSLSQTASAQCTVSASLRASETKARNLESQNASLSENLETAEAKVQDLEQALASARLEESRLRSTSASIESEMHSTETSIQQAVGRAKRGEERAQAAEMKLTAATFELEELRSNYTTLDAQVKCAKKESAAASERAKKAEERASGAEDNLVTAQIQLEKAESQLSEELTTINTMRVRLDSATRDGDTMRRENEVLRRQVTEGQHKGHRLEDQLTASQKDLSDTHRTAEAAEDELLTLKRQHEDASRKCHKYEHQLGDTRQDLEMTRERLKAAEDEVLQLRRVNIVLPTREQLDKAESENRDITTLYREMENQCRGAKRELEEARASLRRADTELEVLESRLQNDKERLETQHERIEAELKSAVDCLQQDVSQLRADVKASEDSERLARTEHARIRGELTSSQQTWHAETAHLKELLEEEREARCTKETSMAVLEADLRKAQATSVSTEETSARMLQVEASKKEEVVAQLTQQCVLERELVEELNEKLKVKERWIANHSALEHKLYDALNSSMSESLHQGCEAVSFSVLVQQAGKACDDLLEVSTRNDSLEESAKSLTEKLGEQKKVRRELAAEVDECRENLAAYESFESTLRETLQVDGGCDALVAAAQQHAVAAEKVPSYKLAIEKLENTNQMLDIKAEEYVVALAEKKEQVATFEAHRERLEAIGKARCGVAGPVDAILTSLDEELHRMSVWQESKQLTLVEQGTQCEAVTEGGHLAHAQRMMKQLTVKSEELGDKVEGLEAEVDRLQTVCLPEAEEENKELREKLAECIILKDTYAEHVDRMKALQASHLSKRRSEGGGPSMLRACLDTYRFESSSGESSPTMLEVRAPTPLSRKVSLDPEVGLGIVEVTGGEELEVLRAKLKGLEAEADGVLRGIEQGGLEMDTLRKKMSVVEIDAASAAAQCSDTKRRLEGSQAEVVQLKLQIQNLRETETEQSFEIDLLQTEQSNGRQTQLLIEQHAAKAASLEMEIDDLRLTLDQERCEKTTVEEKLNSTVQLTTQLNELQVKLNDAEQKNHNTVKSEAAAEALQSECKRLRLQLDATNEEQHQWLEELHEAGGLVINDVNCGVAALRDTISTHVKKLRGDTPPFIEDNMSILIRCWEAEAELLQKNIIPTEEDTLPLRQIHRDGTILALCEVKNTLCGLYEALGVKKNVLNAPMTDENIIVSPCGGALPPLGTRSDTPLYYQYRSRSGTPFYPPDDAFGCFEVDRGEEVCWGKMVKLDIGWWVADVRGVSEDAKRKISTGLDVVSSRESIVPIWESGDDATVDGVEGDVVGSAMSAAYQMMVEAASRDPVYNLLKEIVHCQNLPYLSSVISRLHSRETSLSNADSLILLLSTLSTTDLDLITDQPPGTHTRTLKDIITQTPRLLLRNLPADPRHCSLTALLHNALSLPNPLPTTVYRELYVSRDIASDHLGLAEGVMYGWAAPAIVTEFPITPPRSPQHIVLTFCITGVEKGARLPHRVGEVLLPPFSLFQVGRVVEVGSGVRVDLTWVGVPDSDGVPNDGFYLMYDLEMSVVSREDEPVKLPVGLLKENLGLDKLEEAISQERNRSQTLRSALDETPRAPLATALIDLHQKAETLKKASRDLRPLKLKEATTALSSITELHEKSKWAYNTVLTPQERASSISPNRSHTSSSPDEKKSGKGSSRWK